MKKWMSLLAALLLLLGMCAQASAQDVFTIDVDLLDMGRVNSDDYVARELSASAQGVSVRKYISSSSELAAPVRLTLTQMDQGVVMFDKDYGYQSGTFDSGVIYLPYVDDRTIPYLVTLYVGNYVYAMPFMQLQPRLSGNGACLEGVRLGDLSPSLGSDWLMAAVVDMDALRASSRSVNICASNSCVIGTATLSASGSAVKVDLSFYPSANVSINEQTLYVSADFDGFAAGQRGAASTPGQWVDVGSASAVVIYLPMKVSYDPAGLPAFRYDSAAAQSQLALWQSGRSGSAPAYAPSYDGGSASGGWDAAWDDGWNASGWDDSWNSDASGWMDSPGGW